MGLDQDIYPWIEALLKEAREEERKQAAEIVEGYQWSTPPFTVDIAKEHNLDIEEAKNRILTQPKS